MRGAARRGHGDKALLYRDQVRTVGDAVRGIEKREQRPARRALGKLDEAAAGAPRRRRRSRDEDARRPFQARRRRAALIEAKAHGKPRALAAAARGRARQGGAAVARGRPRAERDRDVPHRRRDERALKRGARARRVARAWREDGREVRAMRGDGDKVLPGLGHVVHELPWDELLAPKARPRRSARARASRPRLRRGGRARATRPTTTTTSTTRRCRRVPRHVARRGGRGRGARARARTASCARPRCSSRCRAATSASSSATRPRRSARAGRARAGATWLPRAGREPARPRLARSRGACSPATACSSCTASTRRRAPTSSSTRARARAHAPRPSSSGSRARARAARLPPRRARARGPRGLAARRARGPRRRALACSKLVWNVVDRDGRAVRQVGDGAFDDGDARARIVSMRVLQPAATTQTGRRPAVLGPARGDKLTRERTRRGRAREEPPPRRLGRRAEPSRPRAASAACSTGLRRGRRAALEPRRELRRPRRVGLGAEGRRPGQRPRFTCKVHGVLLQRAATRAPAAAARCARATRDGGLGDERHAAVAGSVPRRRRRPRGRSTATAGRRRARARRQSASAASRAPREASARASAA